MCVCVCVVVCAFVCLSVLYSPLKVLGDVRGRRAAAVWREEPVSLVMVRGDVIQVTHGVTAQALPGEPWMGLRHRPEGTSGGIHGGRGQ